MTHLEQAERDAHGRWRRGSGNPAGWPRGTKTPSGCRPRSAPLDDDHAGLLWRVEGGKLMIMSADSAIIQPVSKSWPWHGK